MRLVLSLLKIYEALRTIPNFRAALAVILSLILCMTAKNENVWNEMHHLCISLVHVLRKMYHTLQNIKKSRKTGYKTVRYQIHNSLLASLCI